MIDDGNCCKQHNGDYSNDSIRNSYIFSSKFYVAVCLTFSKAIFKAICQTKIKKYGPTYD